MCEIISCSEQNECDSLCLPANVTWEDLISNSLRSGCKDPFSDTQYAQRLVVCWGFFEAEPWQVLLHFIPPQHHSSVFCCCPPFRQQYWCFEFSSQIVHMKVFHTVKVYFYTIDLLHLFHIPRVLFDKFYMYIKSAQKHGSGVFLLIGHKASVLRVSSVIPSLFVIVVVSLSLPSLLSACYLRVSAPT